MYGFKHKKREKRHTSMPHVFPSKKYTFLPFLASSQPHRLLYASPLFKMLQSLYSVASFHLKKTIKLVLHDKLFNVCKYPLASLRLEVLGATG